MPTRLNTLETVKGILIVSKELDQGQKNILKATEELLHSVKAHGLKMNFLDAVCKFCHKEFGHAQSEEGFPWDVEFICQKEECQNRHLLEMIKQNTKDRNCLT